MGGAGGTAARFDPLEGIGTVELVADGFEFTEGPTWRTAEQRLLFSDIDGNTIYELTPPNAIAVFRADSGNSNGLDSDVDGLLLTAEHGNRRLSRTLPDGTIVDVASQYLGDPLNSPNDIAVRSDGTIYFTDPPYGIDPETEQVLEFNGVFRVDPDGELTVEWEGAKSTRPNGLVLSPDERILYVADTMAPGTGSVLAFDVEPDGSLSGQRTFVSEPGFPDGMTIDTGGNLFVATVPGVRVYDPEGNLWGTIEVPRIPANCAFGGDDARTLYITAREALYHVSLVHPGLY
jgi:gluconolactonase